MILVLGGASYQKYFSRLGEVTSDWKNVSWEDVKLCVFTGGEDVDPSLYGETPHKTTFSNIKRDKFEQVIFQTCVKNDIPMVGICRGAQFLTVMNGGKLHQHVEGHTFGHLMRDVATSDLIWVTSTHHQMMRPWLCKDFEVLATASIAGADDPEVVKYHITRSLAIQYHPEVMGLTSDAVKYTDDLIKEMM